MKSLFTHMLPEPRIIEDFAGTRAQALLSTPLWPGGPAWQGLPVIARTDLPASERKTHSKARFGDFWLAHYMPAFGDIILAIDRSPLMGGGLMS